MYYFASCILLLKNVSRNFLISIIFLLVHQICFAAIKTWTGSGGDNNWSNPANWNNNTIPSASDDIILDNSVIAGSYIVILPPGAVTISVNSLAITPSTGNTIQLNIPSANTANPGLNITGSGDALVLNSGAVLINSTGSGSGAVGVAITNTFRINDGGKYVHNNTRGNATIVSQLSIASGTEKGIFEFDVPGAAGYTVSLSNRKFGTLVFSSTAAGGTKIYTGSGSNPLTVNGDLQINSGVTLNADLATANGNILVNGDYIQNGGTFNIASGPDNSIVKIKGNLAQLTGSIITESSTGLPVIELNGNVQQNISLKGSINNSISFRMNNVAGAVLLAPLSLPYKLELLSGNITTTTTNLLTLQSGAVLSVDSTISNTSFISGPLRREGLSNAVYSLFPVGKNSLIRWAELKNATGNFTIEFIQSDPRALSNTYGTGIDHISSNDYWQINADASPTASANVELSFANALTSGVTDMSTLRVAQLSAGAWVDRNNISTTGSAGASGSVVSTAISNFNSSNNSFALASNTGNQNPLPVKLISFSATKSGNVVLLNWQIDSPKDAAYFTVMSSSNNQDFSSGEKIDAVDFQTSYQFTDEHPSNGIIYYRLQVTEKSGNSYLSKVVTIDNNNLVLGLHFTSYMLVQNSIGINVTSPAGDKLQLLLINSDGKVMKNIFMQLSTGDNRLTLDLSGIASGVYYVTGQNQKQRTNVLRFIKQ